MTINDSPAHPNERTEPPPDPRPAFHLACRQADAIIAAVTADDLRRPTPCSEFDVEDLTRHLLSVGHRTIALAGGEPAESVPLDAPGLDPTGFHADWGRTRRVLQGELAADGVLDQLMVVPWATLPGAVVLAVYAAEIQIHSWDLATALGQRPEWDQELAETGLAVVQMGIPAEGRGDEMPFAPVVPTAEDAPAMDRLVAWMGRDPGWVAS
ncbi:MAG: TIGR03086 family metal-binding protein [Actinomycetota bacterium]